MSRLLRIVPALCLFAACGNGAPKDVGKSETAQPATPPDPVELACRVDEVRTFARALGVATPRERRSKVAEGLKAACDVPPSYVAFLDATDRDAKREDRFEAAIQAIDLLDELCPNPEQLTSALAPMKPDERPTPRLSEMKWKKAGAEEYGGPPASAVVAQRACGRVWIGAERARSARDANPRTPRTR